MRNRHVIWLPTAIGVLGASLLLAASQPAEEVEWRAEQDAQVERGEYLVAAGDCNGCHTPAILTPEGPVPDSTRRLSGYPADLELPEIPEGAIGPDGWGGMWTSRGTAFAGSWGVSFPRNLTPDAETGLGSWTTEIFIKAMRTGKDMGEGRDILPPMPWREFRKLTDEDLAAIFAYLQSLDPIDNPVPDPIDPSGESLPTLKAQELGT